MPNPKQPAGRSSPYSFQYAAKFVCISNNPNTSIATASLLSGNYKTVVNVHNPNDRAVKIRTKVALGAKAFISKFKDASLGPDELKRIACAEIGDHEFEANLVHGATEGFLVIESSDSLDVVAVYTAGALRGDVASIDVEQVRERQLHKN
jgi:hypothetical protein